MEDDNGVLIQRGVSKRMNEDVLSYYQVCHIYYDPIKNEYDCCEKYDLGAPGGPLDDDDDDDDDDIFWDGNDMNMNQADDNRILPTWIPSPDVEINDTWNLHVVEAPNPLSTDNFISEIHRILFMHFGYTPAIPVPTFRDPVLQTE